jgi:hypothetical protein
MSDSQPQQANSGNGQTLLRPDDILKLHCLPDDEKQKFRLIMQNFWTICNQNQQGSPENTNARQKLSEWSQKLISRERQYRGKMKAQQQQGQGNQGQASQANPAGQQNQNQPPPKQETPQALNRSAEGVAAPAAPNSQGQPPQNQAQNRGQPDPAIVKHVHEFPMQGPLAGPAPGTPEYEAKLKEYRNGYLNMLAKQSSIGANRRKLISQMSERQNSGQEITQEMLTLKAQLEKEHTQLKAQIDKFRSLQKQWKEEREQKAQSQGQAQQMPTQSPQQQPAQQPPQQPSQPQQPQQQSQQQPQQPQRQPSHPNMPNMPAQPQPQIKEEPQIKIEGGHAPQPQPQPQFNMPGNQQQAQSQQQPPQQQNQQQNQNQQFPPSLSQQQQPQPQQQQQQARPPPAIHSQTMPPNQMPQFAQPGQQQQNFHQQQQQQQQRPQINPMQANAHPQSNSPHPQSATSNAPGPPVPLSHQAAVSAANRSYTDPQRTNTPMQQGGQGSFGSREREQLNNPKMPIPRHLNVTSPQAVHMGQARPTMSGPTNGAPGPMGQPVIPRPPPYQLEGDGDRVLSKRKLDELVRQVTGGSEEALTPEVEEVSYSKSNKHNHLTIY